MEEKLKRQRESMEQGFRVMEQGFDWIGKRFVHLEIRFYELTRHIDRFAIWVFLAHYLFCWSGGNETVASDVSISGDLAGVFND